MPHLPVLRWNFRDQLRATSRRITSIGAREMTYYAYDAAGQRIRKTTVGRNGKKTYERLYFGGFEVFRKFNSQDEVTLKRETLHVMDDKRRIALVETQTSGAVPVPALRYQLANHLGSACLELDRSASLISYEEYSPYGSTTFQANRNAAEIGVKRYRYTGKERDEESGFTYHGARYFAPWLGDGRLATQAF